MILNNGMGYDLRELIDKYEFDLNRLTEASLSAVNDNATGAIYAIPFENNDRILFYQNRVKPLPLGMGI